MTNASGAYLTHLNDASASLSGYGYDTFGRIKNHRWKDSSGTLLAGWSHNYDRVGNKVYQEDLVLTTTDDELHDHDAVYRVTSFKRGSLDGTRDDSTRPGASVGPAERARNGAWGVSPRLPSPDHRSALKGRRTTRQRTSCAPSARGRPGADQWDGTDGVYCSGIEAWEDGSTRWL